jgi:hypothetical protein
MNDLRSLMQSRAGELSSKLERHSDLDDSTVVARVRSKRRRNAALTGAASVAGVTVVALGALLMVNQFRDNEPALPPAPSMTATPTPSPSPTSSPNPSLADPGFAGTVTSSPYLPSAQAITPEVWASAESGWVLTTYKEQWSDSVSEETGTGPHAVYLISPQGERYELTMLAPDSGFQILWWEPGSTMATVGRSDLERETGFTRRALSDIGLMDLTTGAYSPQSQPVDPASLETHSMWLDHDGTPVYRTDQKATEGFKGGAGGILVPYSPPVSAATLNSTVTALSSAAADRDCSGTGIASATEMLITCGLSVEFSFEGCSESYLGCAHFQAATYAAGADGSTRVVYESDQSELLITRPSIAAGQVIGEAWDVDCPRGLAAVSGSNARLIIGPYDTSHPEANIFGVFGASGTSAYVTVTSGCSGDVAPTVLARVDLADDRLTELVPYPGSSSGDVNVPESVQGYFVVP